jgi:prolyl oligopeptidase
MYKTNTPDIDTDSYLTKQLWCTSKDGTRIPLFITCKKGLEPDGKNPLLLIGYGGFGMIRKPYFYDSYLLFMKKGGIYVEACLRGGGEFGEEWHEGGMKLNKQNTFDDFIAVAEYLIDNKYTSPEKLAINGGSNGGLLVSACMVQRPDLYRVVIDHRGVMDMLFLRWTNEYGTLENEDEYRYFLGYSPLHQIKQGVNYPATWISTGMNDVVVPPWQSFKFAAAMQLAQGSSQPVLLRTDSIAGHNSISIEEDTDWLSFLFWNLDMNY